MAAAALLGITQFQNSPLLSNAVPCALAALSIQAAVGVPSTYLVNPPTEKYYDLTGALTNVAVAVLSLYLPRWRQAAAGFSISPLHWRQLALSGAVALWATRLGTYLFRRIMRDGSDSRFEPMRSAPSKLLFAWFAQALWITLCQSPVTAVNAVRTLPNRVLWTDILGFGLFFTGLAIESVADYQKSSWVQAKHAKQHDELFMTRGLFSRCRYPSYFGETMLWTGLAVVGAGVLTRGSVRTALGGISIATGLAVAAVSPAFTSFILLKLSGVPMSEPKYDKRYGDRADYQAWKRNTPLFFPKLF
ncbi:3-oxo-5-alpha-steroid 4-dehydrogenase [Ophiostoma piceae UAMH 11346]|uniref:3-oxo-5-alpha-steroid 4-dehydrogenase n=1 Tax=Ophiostoma piceae (strain UAMH 11346) TaxID=1262450 RepID=S3BZY5_OPHP1|nr:3-oxo-5-alpha-steroid 4-dehydrogenase [Ophiostoma piceae UAMH 11346]